jgi:alanyl-tRNA synthetase
MTELLYYHDSYAIQFQARVVERVRQNGRPGVVLDRTFFYPTSGGQPYDTGLINGLSVENVYIRDEDDAVVHLMSADPQSDDVEGEVAWDRRFDHMQQHTGQHILSQAFVRIAGAPTIGFHMSAESSTLDLDIEAGELSEESLIEAERLSNKIIWENRPVNLQFVTAAQAQNLPLRKLPDAKDGVLRLVSIDAYDLSACGGTHVARTGEIGIIKVVKTERQKKKIRLEFLCGGRALADYDRKNLVLGRLSAEMTTGYWEIESSVTRLRDDLKTAQRSHKRKTNQLLSIEAKNLVAHGTHYGDTAIICKVFENRDPQELRRLVGQVASSANTVVLVGLAGAKAQLIFARSDNVNVRVNQVLQQVLPILGEATGGGSEKFAQGGGSAATTEQVAMALQAAEKAIRPILLESDDDGP